MKKQVVFFCILMTLVGLVSCKKFLSKDFGANHSVLSSPVLPDVPFDYEGKHLVNNDMATLGRVLFFDNNLSTNNSVSCGSCHLQELAFASNQRFDKGFDGRELSRNTPSIQALRGFNHFDQKMRPTMSNQAKGLFFWDGRQDNLVDMVLNPVLNHREMNMPDFETLEKKLAETSYYPALFKAAFGESTIEKEKIAFALVCFIQCLDPKPGNNKLEENSVSNSGGPEPLTFSGNIGFVDTVGFTEEEKYGRFLFHTQYNCANCHDPSKSGSYGGTMAGNPLMFNIGLDAVYADKGLGALSKRASDEGVFKVPTLLNIALTAPYMHDGRFNTLEEVIDHYSHNIQASPALSTEFMAPGGGAKKLNISIAQKKALVAFLKKLTTPDFISNPMYSNPFVAQ
jgi:cytochrome c peroxidase